MEGRVARAFVKDMYAGTLKVGDPVQFVTKDGYSPLVQPVITAIRPAKPTAAELADVKKGLVPQIARACNTMVEVTFDRDCDAFKPGALFVSQNQNGNGFVLKNCRFGPNRARGFSSVRTALAASSATLQTEPSPTASSTGLSRSASFRGRATSGWKGARQVM